MFRQKRIPNGRPMDGTDVVAVDVIALLSGVNFGSVVKIIAAIEAICIHLDKSPEEVVRFRNAPTAPVQFDGCHEARIAATDDMVHDMVNNPRLEFLNYVLRHKLRFANELVAAAESIGTSRKE